MTGFFGFKPSPVLEQNFKEALVGGNSMGRPLYMLREELSDNLVNDLLDVLLVQLVESLPANDKKDMMLKLSHFIQSTATKLMSSLFDKGSDDSVQPSIAFFNRAISRQANNELLVGMPLSGDFTRQLLHSLGEAEAGNGKAEKDQLKALLILFSDQLIQFYLHDFSKTLNLGMIKRKGVDIASTAMSKMIQMTVNKMVDNLGTKDLISLGRHYKPLFYVI